MRRCEVIGVNRTTVTLSLRSSVLLERAMAHKQEIEEAMSTVAKKPVKVKLGVNIDPKSLIVDPGLKETVNWAERELGAEVGKVRGA